MIRYCNEDLVISGNEDLFAHYKLFSINLKIFLFASNADKLVLLFTNLCMFFYRAELEKHGHKVEQPEPMKS